MNKLKKAIWIDIDNAPHVQIFAPIINELKKCENVIVTAKDYGQTIDLLMMKNIDFIKIGKHPGKNIILKILGNITRAVQLMVFIRKFAITLSICHGSRALIIASWLLRIKSIIIFDYECSEKLIKIKLGTFLLIPEMLGKEHLIELGYPKKKLNEYPGIKENIYIPFFNPDHQIYDRLKINRNKIIITFRPPSEVSHYNSGIDYNISFKLLDYLLRSIKIQIILLFRYKKQEIEYKDYLAHQNIIIPKKTEDGLNLIYHSDIIISGGGTMNREAAAMNVPVYSIFKGPKGIIDIKLQKEGKMQFIEREEDFSLIHFCKRTEVNENLYSLNSFKNVITFIHSKL